MNFFYISKIIKIAPGKILFTEMKKTCEMLVAKIRDTCPYGGWGIIILISSLIRSPIIFSGVCIIALLVLNKFFNNECMKLKEESIPLDGK